MCAEAEKLNYVMPRVMSRINFIWYWSHSHRVSWPEWWLSKATVLIQASDRRIEVELYPDKKAATMPEFQPSRGQHTGVLIPFVKRVNKILVQL